MRESVTVFVLGKVDKDRYIYPSVAVDEDNNRHICKAYTISVADTWEYFKTLTFAGGHNGSIR